MLLWELNSFFMKILREKILLFWLPTWPPCHVVANREFACCGNHCWLAIVLCSEYFSLSFQFFVLRHLTLSSCSDHAGTEQRDVTRENSEGVGSGWEHSLPLPRRAKIKQLAWPMAEQQIGHRKSCLVLSARFPVVSRSSRQPFDWLHTSAANLGPRSLVDKRSGYEFNPQHQETMIFHATIYFQHPHPTLDCSDTLRVSKYD